MAYVSRGFIPQTSLASNLGFTRPMYIPAGNGTATALYDIVKVSTSGSTADTAGVPAGLSLTLTTLTKLTVPHPLRVWLWLTMTHKLCLKLKKMITALLWLSPVLVLLLT